MNEENETFRANARELWAGDTHVVTNIRVGRLLQDGACTDTLRWVHAESYESLERTVASLRRDLADPPADVQEVVLRKLDLWPPPRPWKEREGPHCPSCTCGADEPTTPNAVACAQCGNVVNHCDQCKAELLSTPAEPNSLDASGGTGLPDARQGALSEPRAVHEPSDALSRVKAVLPKLDPYDASVVQQAIDSAEPSGDLACKFDGACASQGSVRQMCWPCQMRWHRKQADEIERALRADEKPKRVEPRGDDRPAEPERCYKCQRPLTSCHCNGSPLNRDGDANG